MTNQIIYPTCFPCVYCQHRQGDACGRPVVHQASGVARPFLELHLGFVSDCQFQRSGLIASPGMCGKDGAFFCPVPEVAGEWSAARYGYVTFPAPARLPFWLGASAGLAILAALIAWGLS